MIELFRDKSNGLFVVAIDKKNVCVLSAIEMIDVKNRDFYPVVQGSNLEEAFYFIGDFNSLDDLLEFFIEKYAELMI